MDKVDVLSDHMNVSDHLPVVAELKIKNPLLMLRTGLLILNQNGTSVIIESIRILLVEILVGSRMTWERNLNSCVH